MKVTVATQEAGKNCFVELQFYKTLSTKVPRGPCGLVGVQTRELMNLTQRDYQMTSQLTLNRNCVTRLDISWAHLGALAIRYHSFELRQFRSSFRTLSRSSAGLGPHLEVQKLQAMRRTAAPWHWICAQATRIHLCIRKDPRGVTRHADKAHHGKGNKNLASWPAGPTRLLSQLSRFLDLSKVPIKTETLQNLVGRAAWAKLLYVGTLLRSRHKAWKKYGELSPIPFEMVCHRLLLRLRPLCDCQLGHLAQHYQASSQHSLTAGHLIVLVLK